MNRQINRVSVIFLILDFMIKGLLMLQEHLSAINDDKICE
jgi:hypothetical protein